MKKFGNKNNLRFQIENTSESLQAARAVVKKLRIATESVRIGEQELVEVGREKLKNRRGNIKTKDKLFKEEF